MNVAACILKITLDDTSSYADRPPAAACQIEGVFLSVLIITLPKIVMMEMAA